MFTTFSLNAQQTLHIGMTADEFKTKLPGILPDTTTYDADLYLQEKLHSIDGRWSFDFIKNTLHSAD